MPAKIGSVLALVLGLSVAAGAGPAPGKSVETLPFIKKHTRAGGAGCQQPQPVSPALRQEILTARKAVWRAWFANDRKELEIVIPKETIAINAGEEHWQNRAEILTAAKEFVEGGGKLLRLEYPRTEIQLYGDVAILYTTYVLEFETEGRRQTLSGRGTEIFVRRNGRWVNSGWHLDSGQ